MKQSGLGSLITVKCSHEGFLQPPSSLVALAALTLLGTLLLWAVVSRSTSILNSLCKYKPFSSDGSVSHYDYLASCSPKFMFQHNRFSQGQILKDSLVLILWDQEGLGVEGEIGSFSSFGSCCSQTTKLCTSRPFSRLQICWVS